MTHHASVLAVAQNIPDTGEVLGPSNRPLSVLYQTSLRVASHRNVPGHGEAAESARPATLRYAHLTSGVGGIDGSGGSCNGGAVAVVIGSIRRLAHSSVGSSAEFKFGKGPRQ